MCKSGHGAGANGGWQISNAGYASRLAAHRRVCVDMRHTLSSWWLGLQACFDHVERSHWRWAMVSNQVTEIEME